MNGSGILTDELLAQLTLLAYSFVMGIFLRVLYDPLLLLRCFRKPRRHVLLETVEDLIYWAVCALLMCSFVFYHNNGIARNYVIFSALLGALCYHYALGRFWVPLLAGGVKRIFQKLMKIIKKQ